MSRESLWCFLDADDRLCPNHLQTCLEAFYLCKNARFVCGNYRWMDGERVQHIQDCRPSYHHYATLLRTNFIGPLHAVMFRRAIVSAVGGFAPDFNNAIHGRCGSIQPLVACDDILFSHYEMVPSRPVWVASTKSPRSRSILWLSSTTLTLTPSQTTSSVSRPQAYILC